MWISVICPLFETKTLTTASKFKLRSSIVHTLRWPTWREVALRRRRWGTEKRSVVNLILFYIFIMCRPHFRVHLVLERFDYAALMVHGLSDFSCHFLIFAKKEWRNTRWRLDSYGANDLVDKVGNQEIEKKKQVKDQLAFKSDKLKYSKELVWLPTISIKEKTRKITRSSVAWKHLFSWSAYVIYQKSHNDIDFASYGDYICLLWACSNDDWRWN